jgi:hypothetical protein
MGSLHLSGGHRALVAVGFVATRLFRFVTHSFSFRSFLLPVVAQVPLFAQPQNLVGPISSVFQIASP